MPKGTLSDGLWQWLAPLLPAILGGVAHGVNCKLEEFSWWWFLVGLVMAVFVGQCVHCIVSEMTIADGWKTTAVAVSGYSAGEILTMLKGRVFSLLKK